VSNRSNDSEWEQVTWLKTGEAAQILGISKNTLKRLVREGYLKAYRIKGVAGFQFRKKDVLGLIEKVTPEEIDEEN
jgi:excisionase family DNA binding protein